MDAIGRAASGIAYWGSQGSGIHLKVDQTNVMAAARLVMAEAVRFRRHLDLRRDGLEVVPVGGDPVSVEAARVLNLKFWQSPDSYLERCVEYAEMLEVLAEQLGAAARTYGNTDDDVRALFDSVKQDAGVV